MTALLEVGQLRWVVTCTDIQSHYANGACSHVVVLKGKAPACKLYIETEHELPYRVGEEYFLDLSLLDGDETT